MTRILVVDDSAVDRRFIGELLSREPGWGVEFAEDGAKALAKIKASVPDLVLTDLQMPELNGLELVTLAHLHSPKLPVVLITAYGSEELALEALERGAAHYIPKADLIDKLVDTVKEVLELAEAKRDFNQVLPCLSGARFNFVLENDPGVLDSLVDLVQQIVVHRHLCNFIERLQIGVALKEALLNAMFHGNLEIGLEQMREVREKLSKGEPLTFLGRRRSEPPYCERRVFFEADLSPEVLRFTIRDEGPGFDVRTVPARGDPGALDPRRGRGISVMQAFMDEVRYNEAGNEVTLVKRRAEGGR